MSTVEGAVDAAVPAKKYIRPRPAITSRALVFGSPAPNGSVVCSWLLFQLCSPQVPLVSPRQQQLHRPISSAIGVWSFSFQLSPFAGLSSFIFIRITFILVWATSLIHLCSFVCIFNKFSTLLTARSVFSLLFSVTHDFSFLQITCYFSRNLIFFFLDCFC